MTEDGLDDMAEFLAAEMDIPTRTTMAADAIIHFERFMEAVIPEEYWDEHLEDTPRRVVESRLSELFRGFHEDPRKHLETTFEEAGQYKGDAGWVVENNIEVNSMCAHHFLPIRGVAHVGYLPRSEVVGLSKLARVVDGYARRPQVQERLTNQVATAIHEELNPMAVGVVIDAVHDCMSLRGVKKSEASTVTSAMRGDAREKDSETKDEFMELIDL